MGKGDENKGVEIKLFSCVLFLPTGLQECAWPRSSTVFLISLAPCICISLTFLSLCGSFLSLLVLFTKK